MGSYLVTGGAGFIGSHIARHLVQRGDEVVVVDNVSTGFEENIPPGVHFVNMDLSRPEEFERIPKWRYEAVCHLAAQTSGEISHEIPGQDLTTNALGTLMLLDWCQRHQVSRFLYASSMAVYGLAESMPVKENDRLDPYSFYGISKQAAEHYVRQYSRRGMDTTVFRLFNVYGPGQNLSNMKQGMVSIYLAFLKMGQPILVRGSLDRFRDFIYIDDVVQAWMTALHNPRSYSQVYNLGSGRKTLVREILAELIRAWGHDTKSYPTQQGDGTPGDQFGIYADITLLRQDLGWEPCVTLPVGLGRMAIWAKSLGP